MNVDGGPNQLWENERNDGGERDYLAVRVLQCLPEAGRFRDDIGATLRLYDSSGVTPLSPMREVNGGRGHGSQDPAVVHFGLPRGGSERYVVEVRFTGGDSGPGPFVRREVVPAEIPGYQLVEIKECETAQPAPLGGGIVAAPALSTPVSVTTLVKKAWSAEVARGAGIDAPGAKDGGLAWCDFNDDRYLDVLLNTSENDASGRSFLYFNRRDGTFADATDSHAAGLKRVRAERSVICGDINNDGRVDFARNSVERIEIYLNKGPQAHPPWSFGDLKQNPSQVIATVSGGMTTEGMGFFDFDADGDLDIVVDSRDSGIDIFENDGRGLFEHATPDFDSRGLPLRAVSGDYIAVADYDADGWVDVLARKDGELDLWRNLGDGTFGPNGSFDEDASTRGGVAFCDMDSDGDFDFVWTDARTSQIWRNEDGNFVPTGEPSRSSGVRLDWDDIDGVACADVDNDGDLDLLLSAARGPSHFFFNETEPGGASSLSFRRDNMGIALDGNGGAVAFADYDRDGDEDLLLSADGGANQLWQNHTNDDGARNFLVVRALRCIGPERFRDDIGATVRLFEADGATPAGPIQEVNGGQGRGSQGSPFVHFGLPSGRERLYIVEVRFPGGSVVRRTVDPSTLGYEFVEVTSCGRNDLPP